MYIYIYVCVCVCACIHSQKESLIIVLDMEENVSMNDNRHHDNSYVSTCTIRGVPIVSLITDSKERLCLAQISNDLLKDFSYNEIHNRRVGMRTSKQNCFFIELNLLCCSSIRYNMCSMYTCSIRTTSSCR